MALLVSGLIATGLPDTARPEEKAIDVELMECLEQLRTVDQRTRARAEVLRLACRSGGTWRGPLGGSRIAGPTGGSAWASGTKYGNPSPGTTPTATARSWSTIRKHAHARKVPWPNPNSSRALNDLDDYGIYTIYSRSSTGAIRTYKYGITKAGRSRPQSQLTRCTETMRGLTGDPGLLCQWRWARTGVKGWLRARRIEAGYATKYKTNVGKCPPGMRRCL